MTLVYALTRALYRVRLLRGSGGAAPVEVQRAAMDRFWGRDPGARGTVTTDVDAGGVRAQWVTARGAAVGRAVVYLHGGGYTTGSPTSHGALASRLSRASGAAVLVVDYRLAPEHRFPSAVDDALAVYRWLAGEGFAPGSITVAGDSAGGGLAVGSMIALREAGEPLPAAAALFAPWVDLTAAHRPAPSSPDPVLSVEGLGQATRAYLGDTDPGDPLVSPVYADLSGLPPMMIQVGTADLLFDEGRRLGAAARRCGIDVVFDEWQGMPHVFQMGGLVSRSSRRAIGAAGAFLREHFT